MDTIFMNSENSKTSTPNVLTLKLVNILDLRFGEEEYSKSCQTSSMELFARKVTLEVRSYYLCLQNAPF